jgi:hypothetical protein
VFKKASVTPNELRDLWDLTKKLINKITYALNKGSHAFNLAARKDAERMLSDLSSLLKR